MYKSNFFNMFFLESAQSQKHVTVNEALYRIDSLGAGVVEAINTNIPPYTPLNGSIWSIGSEPQGDWIGHQHQVALFLNGGWEYVTPWEGWQVWDRSTGRRTIWRNGDWAVDWPTAVSTSGASSSFLIHEVTHLVNSGSGEGISPLIPANSTVFAITARVLSSISSSGTWSLGVFDDKGRYGTDLGVSAGSYAVGLTSQPQAYFETTDIFLTPDAGEFDMDGEILLAVHCMSFSPSLA